MPKSFDLEKNAWARYDSCELTWIELLLELSNIQCAVRFGFVKSY